MLTGWDERARRVLGLTVEEANYLDHRCIGTGHLLIGLLHGADPVAARALTEAGLAREATRDLLDERVRRRAATPRSEPVPFTLPLREVFRSAWHEAAALHRDQVSPEYLLLAALGLERGVAVTVLTSQGVALWPLRTRVVALARGAQADG